MLQGGKHGSPHPQHLRRQAALLARTADFSTLPPLPHDYLTVQAQNLEDAFYRDGRLDPTEWQELAAQFERADRSHRAKYTLEKLVRLQSIMSPQITA